MFQIKSLEYYAPESGLEKEPELAQIRKIGVVSEDWVHLSDMYCGNIAVNLCYRVATAEVQMIREPNKRRRRV